MSIARVVSAVSEVSAVNAVSAASVVSVVGLLGSVSRVGTEGAMRMVGRLLYATTVSIASMAPGDRGCEREVPFAHEKQRPEGRVVGGGRTIRSVPGEYCPDIDGTCVQLLVD